MVYCGEGLLVLHDETTLILLLNKRSCSAVMESFAKRQLSAALQSASESNNKKETLNSKKFSNNLLFIISIKEKANLKKIS